MIKERKEIRESQSLDVKNIDVLCLRIDESETRPTSEEEVEC